MQHVRVYGEAEGKEGSPRRLDLDTNGVFMLELHGGSVMNGRYTQSGEGALALTTFQGESIAAEEKAGVVMVMNAELSQTTADVFSVSCQKARQALRATELTEFTTKTCDQKVGEGVYNSTHNHGVRPQLRLRPPQLLRDMAPISDVPPPLKVQGVVEDFPSLEGLSLRDTGVISYSDLRTLDALLQKSANLKLLDLRGALDAKGQPSVPKEEVEKEVHRLSVAWGPIKEDEEENEALDKLKAAIAPEEYTTAAAAFKHIAKNNLNRVNMLLRALEQNASITSLDLSANSLGTDNEGKKSFRQLRLAKRALEDHPTLTKLCLADNEMGSKGTGVLIKSMVQNIRVDELDLSGNGLCDEDEEENDDEAEADDPAFGEALSGLEGVGDLLKKNKFLRKLSLARNNVKPIELPEDDLSESFGDDTPLYKMLLPLRTFHRLTALDISGNEIGPGGAHILGASLKQNRSLTSLNINETAVGHKGLEHLAAHLVQANNLRELHMRRNEFAGVAKYHDTATGLKGKRNAKATAKAVAGLVKYLSSEMNHLETLDIAYNNMGPEACKQVLDALGDSNITHLDISLNHLCGASTNEYQEEGVEALASLITKVPIASLIARWNFLQPKGASLLSDSLAKSEVRNLDVTQNHLKGVGLSELCKAADKLSILRAGSNGLCGEASAEVASLVERSSVLTVLDISDDALGTDGVATIMEGVTRSKLVALNISKNLVGPEAAPQVAAAMKLLRTLDAGDNNFGAEAIMKHIIPNLAGNSILRTLVAWGGGGSAADCLEQAISTINSEQGSVSLIHLDLGVPLTDVQGNLAGVNACAAKLLDNLKRADFTSALEIAL